MCKITRNLAAKLYHTNTAQKRNSHYDVALDELAQKPLIFWKAEALDKSLLPVNHHFTAEVQLKNGDYRDVRKNISGRIYLPTLHKNADGSVEGRLYLVPQALEYRPDVCCTGLS